MTTDQIYEQCIPVLQDAALEEEDKTDRLEELIRKEAKLTGKPLENAVLDTLWRFRNGGNASASPISRHTVVRKQSPAPWQSSRSATPADSSPRSSTASPAPPPGLPSRPSLFRMRSSQRSPFTSPRPSPRLAFASLQHQDASSIPHPADSFGESNADDEIDWRDDQSNASSYAGEGTSSGFLSSGMASMTPYDILRSVLRDDRKDEEIESILEAHDYNLSAAIASLTDGDASQILPSTPEQQKLHLVGKSMAPGSRPVTPAGQAKTTVVCKYWLQTGKCLRADCRFSHDLSNHLCKYWLTGNCIAGDNCLYSHDPDALMSTLSLSDQAAVTPPVEPNFSDFTSFPTLSGASAEFIPSPSRGALAPEFVPSRPQSRPVSRQASNLSRNLAPGFDDNEAFPSLGSAAVKQSKKHHGKRGHGHSHRAEKENSSLADVVRNTPAAPVANARKGAKARPGQGLSRENSAAAQAIPAPQHIPWLETGDAANKAYMKARQEAIRHGGARNKFLQSAAQAWNRNDLRAAKALSLRGQAENDAMREAHRTAARHLYDERNKVAAANPGGEVYIDLHGLHPEEATDYLSDAIISHKQHSSLHRNTTQHIYAIVGTGHHSKGGRDKVGRSIRQWLDTCRFAYREFSVPGDKSANGGILGIDCRSGDVHAEADAAVHGADEVKREMVHGKVRILKAEDRDA